MGDETALYLASREGHTACAEALIAAGADVDRAEAEYGRTPLHGAAKWGHPAIVHALLMGREYPCRRMGKYTYSFSSACRTESQRCPQNSLSVVEVAGSSISFGSSNGPVSKAKNRSKPHMMFSDSKPMHAPKMHDAATPSDVSKSLP